MKHWKYLNEDPTERVDDAGYRVEDGIVVHGEDRPTTRKAYDEFTRYWRKTKDELRAEEALWAARSGPVTVRRIGEEVA